jgi:3-oxoacyl-[acyl-carrier protein] reductase
MLDEALGLAGQVVIVAGAGGGGIGTGVCTLLATAGVTVVAIDNDRDRLAITEQAAANADGDVELVVADVRDPAAVDGAIHDAPTPLHGLVHVAGGLDPSQWAPLATMAPAVFSDVVELNLESAFLTSRAVAARLAAESRGGSIVHIASIAGLLGMPFGAPYAAAKAGMMAMARTAALEWGPLGIRVNAVAPGTIRTAKNQDTSSVEEGAEERDAIPLGRRGRPEDIAAAVLFLLSDLAAFVTGQVLAVDGGSSVRPSYLGGDNLPVFVHDPTLETRLGLNQP